MNVSRSFSIIWKNGFFFFLWADRNGRVSSKAVARLKEVVYSHGFKEKHRASSRCFTRNRKLPFHFVLFLILNTLRGAVADELDQFFQAVFRWNIPKRFVSPSAFSQARRKLSHTAFLELLDEVCGVVDQAPETATYRGLRVFAIDGSTMRLPDNPMVRNAFGVTRNKHSECAMSRVSLLHDVLNRVTYDAILGRFDDGEIDMVWEHLEAVNLPEQHLILMDRGYYLSGALRLKKIFLASKHNELSNVPNMT